MDLIYSANCICHVQDLDDCFSAVAEVLDKKGMFVFEDPSLIEMLKRGSYDQIYDEHAHIFSVTALEKLLKAAAVYQLPDLSAVGEAGVVKLVVRDKKNDTSNEFAIVVGETDKEFVFNFKVENIKIIPGAYNVVVSQKLLSKFTNESLDLKYFIALEPDSTFG